MTDNAKVAETKSFPLNERGTFCNNRRFTHEFGFVISNVDTTEQLLSIPYDNDGDLLGLFIAVDNDYVWINCTGRNGSIEDWHRIESINDHVVVEIVRKRYNVDAMADVRVHIRNDGIREKLVNSEKHTEEIAAVREKDL